VEKSTFQCDRISPALLGMSRITTARLRNTLEERGALLNAASTVPYVKSGQYAMFVRPKVNYSMFR
jgi:hypothetical protein